MTGSWPRVTRDPQRTAGRRYAVLRFRQRRVRAHPQRSAANGDTELDRSLTRLDFSPQIRFPFKRWQWFTVNSTASWRDTYYSRSLDPLTTDPVTDQPTIIDDDLNRRYLTFRRS